MVAVTDDTQTAEATLWARGHETAEGLELCPDCTALIANGEHNPDYSEYPTAEALVAAIEKVWPSAEGWNVDYAGCGEDEDDGDSRAHIDFVWSQCDGCHSQLGGSRCVGFAWRIRPHTFEVARFTGNRVCSVCGLLPLDEDDTATPCLLPATA